MPRKEVLTETEQRNLRASLEHIQELEHLIKKHPVETFKALMNLNIPMELELEIEGGTYAVKFNERD